MKVSGDEKPMTFEDFMEETSWKKHYAGMHIIKQNSFIQIEN